MRSYETPKAFDDKAHRSRPPSTAAIFEARLQDGVHDGARDEVADRIEVNYEIRGSTSGSAQPDGLVSADMPTRRSAAACVRCRSPRNPMCSVSTHQR
jgi:hypothetical protein